MALSELGVGPKAVELESEEKSVSYYLDQKTTAAEVCNRKKKLADNRK